MFVEFTAIGMRFAAFISIDRYDSITVHRMQNLQDNQDAMFLLRTTLEPEIAYAIRKEVENKLEQ